MRYRLKTFVAALAVSLSWVALGSAATDAITDAVADSNRPAAQIKLDAARKPAQLIAFAGVEPGDSVAEFMPGNAYFTRILSKVVGAKGQIYAFTPTEQIDNCEPAETAGSRAIEHDPAYQNVTQLSAPVNRFSTQKKVDVIWTAQNYHDLHDKFLGPADVKRVNQSFFDALKAGGVLIIIDHAAAPGSGLRDTESLHRIDPASVRHEVEAVGFIFDGQIDVLSNPEDNHSRSVFDPAIRGRTDQFAYKFRRPGIVR